MADNDDWEKVEKSDDWERVPMKPLRPPTSQGKSLGLGALQGGSYGTIDEAGALPHAVVDYLKGKFGTRGPISWDDAYNTNINANRKIYKRAEEDNPKTYTTGQIGGGIATSLVPGLGALNAAKGAGFAGKVGTGIASGALTGAGMSESNPFSSMEKAEEFAGDVAQGGAIGGTIGGGLHVAGKVARAINPTNFAKKAANVFLNTPEEITDTYVKNPKGVMAAPRRHELAAKYQDILDRLKGEVKDGSQSSRDILSIEGKKVRGSQLAGIFGDNADDLARRSEGVVDDDRQAVQNWLKDNSNKYHPQTEAINESGLVSRVDPEYSTNRVKDLLQSIDNSVDYEVAPGKFGRIDSGIKQNTRQRIDSLLKDASPQYAEQMKKVASDTGLLDEASDVAKTPGALSNVFRRLETDKYGGGQVPKDVIGRLDERMGTDFLEQAKLSNARESFDKSAQNGSRNVSLITNVLKDIPVVGRLAPILGGTIDKYGRQMTMSAVDMATKLNKIYQSEGAQEFAKYAQPIIEAARRGTSSAILTMQLLAKIKGEE